MVLHTRGTPERERLSVVNVLEGCRTRLVQGTEWSDVPQQKASSAMVGQVAAPFTRSPEHSNVSRGFLRKSRHLLSHGFPI